MIGDTDNAKIDDLTARIHKAEGRPVDAAPDKPVEPMNMSRVGFDFMAAILGGALAGWLIEKAIPGLSPWGLIGMILVGFATGIMNIWRALGSPMTK